MMATGTATMMPAAIIDCQKNTSPRISSVVTPVLMTPRGLRVEGASLDELVTLLRALG